MKKKLLVCLLAGLCATQLLACGGNSSKNSNLPDTSVEETEVEVSEDSKDESADEASMEVEVSEATPDVEPNESEESKELEATDDSEAAKTVVETVDSEGNTTIEVTENGKTETIKVEKFVFETSKGPYEFESADFDNEYYVKISNAGLGTGLYDLCSIEKKSDDLWSFTYTGSKESGKVSDVGLEDCPLTPEELEETRADFATAVQNYNDAVEAGEVPEVDLDEDGIFTEMERRICAIIYSDQDYTFKGCRVFY